MRTTLIVMVLLVLTAFLGISRQDSVPAELQTPFVRIGDAEVVVEIADTNQKRQLGLLGREELKDGYGMLFVFPREDIYGFWMKDMNFSIDIIWIGSDLAVRDITPNIAPESYPQSFYPAEPVLYVLEVPADWAERHGITVGADALLFF